MTAALSLVDQGYGVHLVERSNTLGGLLQDVRYNLEGDDVQTYLAEVIEKVQKSSLITLHMGTTVNSST